MVSGENSADIEALLSKSVELYRVLVRQAYGFHLGVRRHRTLPLPSSRVPDNANDLSTPNRVRVVDAHAEKEHLFPRLEHSFVTTIIQTQDKLIAFDPGFGENSPMPSAGFFNQSLSAAGYSPHDISCCFFYTLLTTLARGS
jgi:hypothetical protein